MVTVPMGASCSLYKGFPSNLWKMKLFLMGLVFVWRVWSLVLALQDILGPQIALDLSDLLAWSLGKACVSPEAFCLPSALVLLSKLRVIHSGTK